MDEVIKELEELKSLKRLYVNTKIVKKVENSRLGKIISSFYGKIFCKVKNPITQEEFLDFINATENYFEEVKEGDNLPLPAYGGKRNSFRIYLNPGDALNN